MGFKIEIVADNMATMSELVADLNSHFGPVRVNELVEPVGAVTGTVVPATQPTLALVPDGAVADPAAAALAAQVAAAAAALTAANAGTTTPATDPAAVENPGIKATHDNTGLPYDKRIHSSNHQFVGDGTWRKRRGKNITPEYVAQIEAELRVANPIPAATTPATNLAAAGAADLATTQAATPGAKALADCIALASHILAKSLTPETGTAVAAIMVENGLPAEEGIAALMQAPEKVPAVHFALQTLATSMGI